MTAFFDMVRTFFETCWMFIESVFTGMLRLIKLIPSALGVFQDAISFMPDFLSTFAYLTIIICILSLILGWRSGGQNG